MQKIVKINKCHAKAKVVFPLKLTLLVNALGYLLKFFLTAGQRHDIKGAEQLLNSLKNTIIITDKGYDSNNLIENIEL